MATTYDKASLVMIPSGVKEDKLYSIKPTDGSGDFTFSRGSDIQATRVNSSGLIEKAKVNLIDYSNIFNNWSVTNITFVGGQTGYDGSSDATQITSSANGGQIRNNENFSGVNTLSIYAKQGSQVGIRLRMDADTDADIYVDLRDGSLFSSNNIIDSNVESLGSGWYRCSFSANVSNGSNIRIYPVDSNGAISTGSILIQDAQLNHGLIAQDYVETTTTSVVEGLTADLPRLDYSGGASCPSLLLEPSRTNVDPNSEYLANKPIVTNVSVTTNSTTSPEGVVNASTITNNTTNGQHQLTDNTFSVTSGTDYTISLFLKYNDAQYVRLQFGGIPFGSTKWQNFDVQNGTKGSSGGGITSADASIEDYGNGWYRCIVTADATATMSTGAFQIRILEDDNTADIPSFAGTGLSTYAYGAQLEAGSYPTSYIPTYGAAANRGADFGNDNDLVDTTISFGANDDFTIFYEGSFKDLSADTSMILGGGRYQLGDDYKSYLWARPSSLQINGFAETLMANANHSISDDTNTKILVKRSGSVIDFFVNGSKLTTTQQTTNTAFTFRSFGWSYTNAVYRAVGNAKQLLTFPTALTDAECIALTTI